VIHVPCEVHACAHLHVTTRVAGRAHYVATRAIGFNIPIEALLRAPVTFSIDICVDVAGGFLRADTFVHNVGAIGDPLRVPERVGIGASVCVRGSVCIAHAISIDLGIRVAIRGPLCLGRRLGRGVPVARSIASPERPVPAACQGQGDEREGDGRTT
jgi:hypothetical protein